MILRDLDIAKMQIIRQKMKTSISKHFVAIAILCMAALLSALFCSRYTLHYVIDDSYIFFRYAENLYNGHGLVFNPGEYVEGYSSLLFTLFIVPAFILSVDPVLWVHAGSVFLLMLSAIRIYLYLSKYVSSTVIAVALTAFVFEYNFVSIAMMGTESIVVSYLLLELFLRTSHRPSRHQIGIISLILSLLSVIRPDMLYVFPAIAIYILLRHSSDTRERVYSFCLVFMLPLAVYVSHRCIAYLIYGDFLPNAYYAKVGGELYTVVKRGVKYSFPYFIQNPMVSLAYAIALVNLVLRLSWHKKLFLLLLIANLTYVIVVAGGDGLANFRFFGHFWPVALLLAGITGIKTLPESKVSDIRFKFATVLAICLCFLVPNTYKGFYTGKDGWSRHFVAVGQYLRDNAAPQSIIAVEAAGAIPYYSKLRTIDMLGLNDRFIARSTNSAMGQGKPGHEKGSSEYIIQRAPDYIIPGQLLADNPAESRNNFESRQHKYSWFAELLSSEFISDEYEFVTVKLPRRYIPSEEMGSYYTFLKKRTWLH